MATDSTLAAKITEVQTEFTALVAADDARIRAADEARDTERARVVALRAEAARRGIQLPS